MKKWLTRSSSFLVFLLLAGCNGSSDPLFMPTANSYSGEPPLEVSQVKLTNSLHCTDFSHPDKPPVLLVHGTFTRGEEQYKWNYIPLLVDRGYDVCAVTYPDRGLGDQQVSAEYVVNALRKIYAKTGRKVAMIGHSQGATMPRWALKFWPSARNAVADFVLQAGPNHGTTVADPGGLLSSATSAGIPIPLPAAFFQFSPHSNFVRVLNHGDETPGDIDYTSIYGQFDELVEPSAPVPTAALDWQQHNPHVTNILLQNVCPGYIVEHVTIGTTDALTFKLTLDAISHPGPANVQRAKRDNGGSLCNDLLPLLPQENVGLYTLTGILNALQYEGLDSIPNPHLVTSEPQLKPYAQGILSAN